MFDPILILAPVLLLPIVALLRFTGCHLVFGVEPPDTVDANGTNCGGPELMEGGITFHRDDGASGTTGDHFKSEGGQVFKLSTAVVLDKNGIPASELYATARIGANLKYTFSSLEPGGYVATTKFAEIAGAQNPSDRLFQVIVNSESSGPYNIVSRAGGPLITHDEDFLAQSESAKIVIDFIGLDGTEALVNAIQLQKRDAVQIAPPRLTVFAGATQAFQAIANFDAQFEWDLIRASPSGQLTASGSTSVYIAPASIPVPLQETITLQATAGSSVAQANAPISIYLPVDTTTRGAWVHRYGTEGFVLANTPPDSRLPTYVSQFDVRLTDNTPINVASLGIPNNDPGVLTDPNGNPRPPLVWNDLNGTHGITISFRFLGSDPHLFGFYCLDNGPDRRQRFTVTQLDNAITETVDSTIGTGTFLFWIGSGRIQIDISKVSGSAGINNVVNAVFFR